MPEGSPLRYLAEKFILAYSALEWLRGRVVKRGTRPPLILDAQLRLNGERDLGRGVFVDAPRRELRIRRLGIGTIALPLGENAMKYVLGRASEGARLALAMVWVEGGRLCVALIFRRDVTPIEPRRILALDFNALHNGIAYAVVERDRVLERSVLRPDVSKIVHLQQRAAELDALCARRGDLYCEMARAANSRYWRLLGEWRREAVRLIVKLALQYRAAIVVDAPDDSSVRELKESSSYPANRKALLNFGRLRRLIEGLAEWRGIPYIEIRLYSSVCPECGTKMVELPGRRVRCLKCALEMHRDEVPAMWAARRFDELLQAAKSRSPSFSAPIAPGEFRMLIYPAILSPS